MRWRCVAFALGMGCAPGAGGEGLRCVSSDAVDPMKLQGKYEPYGASPFYSDGRAMRAPPRGVVAHTLPLSFDPVETDAPDAGATMPVPLTRDLLDDGERSFGVFCAVCHGLAGDGDSVVARQMQLRPPPSLHEARIVALSDRDLFRVATEGYGMMAGYRSQLDARARWGVVAYVRALQRTRGRALADLPEAERRALDPGDR